MAFHVPMTFAHGVIMLRDWIGVTIQKQTEIARNVKIDAMQTQTVALLNAAMTIVAGGKAENVAARTNGLSRLTLA